MVWETDLSCGSGLGRALAWVGCCAPPGGGVGVGSAVAAVGEAEDAGAAAGVVACGVCEGVSWLRCWPRWASAGRVRARMIAGAIRLDVMRVMLMDALGKA